MKEIELKIRLINYLIHSTDNMTSIGTEYRFNFGYCRADVVTSSKNMSSVYEIKSASDKVERLSTQIKNYKEYFDFCYVVCVKENIRSVRNEVSKSVGIILIDNGEVKLIRKSNQFIKHNKISLASTLPITILKDLAANNSKYISKYELCESISKKHTLTEIRNISRAYFDDVIKNRYKLFISELGKVVTPDDLLTLSRMPSGLILR